MELHKIVKNLICSTLIVGQIGLLFYNISWAAPVATNSARTTSTQSAKQLGNQSGFEYLNNTQRLATSLDYDF